MNLIASNIIEFRNVGINLGGRVVFKDLNLNIKAGDKIALLGQSGSGKSVFLKLCLGILSPDSGEIRRLDGSEPKSLWKRSGVLFQNDALFESMTVKDNILFNLDPVSENFDTEQYLSQFALSGLEINNPPSGLSGGMRKRLALARALVGKPDILFIDEPTSGLDPATAEKIIELLLNIQHSPSAEKMTMITITHSLECAQKLANRILYVDKDSSSIKELKRDEKINKPYDAEDIRHDSDNKNLMDKVRRSTLKDTFVPQYINGFFTLIGAIYLNLRGIFSFPKPEAFARRFINDVILSIPICVIVSLLLGFLLAAQSASSLAPLGFIGWVPYLLVRSAFGDIGYLLIGFLLCGRIATSFCAEVWKMNVGSEIDAIKTMGKSPEKIILSPALWAYVLGFPLIFILGEASIIGGGLLFSFLGFGGSQLGFTFFLNNAINEIAILQIAETIVKSVLTAGIISIIPMTIGAESSNPLLAKKQTPIPAAVVFSMLLIVIVSLFF